MKWWAALRLRYRILIIIGVVLVAAALAAVIIAVSQPEIRTAVVLLVEGLVEVRTGEAESFIDALVDMLLASGDQMRTGEDGRSVLELDNGMVVIVSPNSVFFVEEMAGEPENAVTRFILNAGEVFSISSETLPEDASYEIETPVGIIGVRGSAMSAAYDPDAGSVEATCLTGECSVRTDTDEVDLTGNQGINVTEAAGIVGDPAPLTVDQWGRWQGAIDLAEQAGAGDAFSGQCQCIPAGYRAGQSVGDLVCEDGTEILFFVGCGEFFDVDIHVNYTVTTYVSVASSFSGITNIAASAMQIERPDGTQVVTIQQESTPYGVDWRYEEPERVELVSGEPYTLTLLDAQGEPIPGATATDIWTGCIEEYAHNFRATVTPEMAIDLSWDSPSTAPGFDPQRGTGSFTIMVQEHPGPIPEGVLFGSSQVTRHVLPWADFGGHAPGIPDGYDDGLALSQLPDGDYDIEIFANSDSAPGSPGHGLECTLSDFNEALTFTRSGDTVTIWPRCECDDRTLVCDDGTVTPDAPECGPIPPGSYVGPCEWQDVGGPGVCIQPPDREPSRILDDLDVGSFGAISISPDAEQIVFEAMPTDGGESLLYLANADGTDARALPRLGNDVTPAWSPDGEWLVFHSSGSLALMRPDGTEPHVILATSDTGPCFQVPQWSPDSQSIVTVVWPEQSCAEPVYPLAVEGLVVSPDGETILPVASFTVEEGDECTWTEIAFSPDGTQVAYTDGACDAWLVNADGSGAPEALEEFPWNWKGDHYPQWYEPEE